MSTGQIKTSLKHLPTKVTNTPQAVAECLTRRQHQEENKDLCVLCVQFQKLGEHTWYSDYAMGRATNESRLDS